MTDQTKDENLRKPYCRPNIKQVKLIPEEAVLAGCEITGGSTQMGFGDCAPMGGAACQYS